MEVNGDQWRSIEENGGQWRKMEVNRGQRRSMEAKKKYITSNDPKVLFWKNTFCSNSDKKMIFDAFFHAFSNHI